MDARDHLFYGFGQIVYAMALSDGQVQSAERDSLHRQMEEGFQKHQIDYTNTEIIFELLDKEKVFTAEETYKEGLKNMKLGGHKMEPHYKGGFINILETIAMSFPPVTIEERHLLDHFKEDLETVH